MAEVTELTNVVVEGARTEGYSQEPTQTRKMQKFIFTKDTKQVLLQTVREHDAHRAPHSNKDETFEKVKDTMIQNLPAAMWLAYQKCSMKTVRDKLRAPLAERRETNKTESQTSGVEEVIRPIEELLDDFIGEIDEAEEEKRRERGELSQKETALTAAGEQIQRNALSRRLPVGDEGTGNSRNAPRKRQHDESNEWYEVLERELAHKRETRNQELQLRQEELELSKAWWEEDKKDRKLYREQTRKQLELLITLSSSRK